MADVRKLPKGAKGVIFVVLGLPGCGKATLWDNAISKIARVKYWVCSALLHEAGVIFDPKRLVPDEIVWEAVQRKLSSLPRGPFNFVYLDGFPRSRLQAILLADWARSNGFCLVVVNLTVPTKVSVERMLKRGREGETNPQDCLSRAAHLRKDNLRALNYLKEIKEDFISLREIKGTETPEKIGRNVLELLVSFDQVRVMIPPELVA